MRKLASYKIIFKDIVNDMSNYLVNNKIKTMVLGLSGGIDSTVVAALAYKVCQDNKDIQLIGVSLPSNTNENQEINNAEQCKHFCNKYIVKNIQDEYSMFSNSLVNGLNMESNPIAEGNLKARIRMMMLYHIAGLNNGIVMDTDNLTEHHLGFFTLHGDVGDMAPIAKLWKHEVYNFAQYLINKTDIYSNEMIEALKCACNITPTDGNGVTSGGDMSQIAPGCVYEEVDEILSKLVSIDKNASIEPTNYDYKLSRICNIDNNISDENSKRILDRYERNKYKHKLPIKWDIALNWNLTLK